MFWNRSPSRLDRIEASLETLTDRVQSVAEQTQFLYEINTATNRRIDRFVDRIDGQMQRMEGQIEEMRAQTLEMRAQTVQLQKAVEYLLSKDG